MNANALFATADRAIPVANDVGLRSPYRAAVHNLRPGSDAIHSETASAETMIFVEEGVIEISVAGAEGYLSQGEFARIPLGQSFAYRNRDDRQPARLLTVPVVRTERALSATTVIVAIAAA